jgi:hypothetical protein
MDIPLIEKIAQVCAWKPLFPEFIKARVERIHELEKLLPSGSGIDCGCKIQYNSSNAKKVIIEFDYHNMDEHGGYCGWTHYRLIITPSLVNTFDLHIVGRNKNDIKEYFYDLFSDILLQKYVVYENIKKR